MDKERPTNAELELAIIHECGTDPKTYKNNRRALIKLKWIKATDNKTVWLTNKDLTGDY